MTTTISSSAPPTSSPARRRRLLSLDNRFAAPVLITCILLVGQLSFGILESYTRTLLAIASSIATMPR